MPPQFYRAAVYAMSILMVIGSHFAPLLRMVALLV